MPDSRSVAQIAADLQALGVRPGDLVMVHASLRRIGPVEGRGEGVVRALEAAVGPGGTLVMNLGARDEWDWVNERPEAERAELLRGGVPFDALRTPADPDIGVLAEVFRQLPGTLVNDHPDARFGARGPLAHALLDQTPWHDYYGPGSSLERLVQLGGKILRLGADPETVTLLHYAEYLAPVPNKRRVRRHHLVAGAAGPEVRAVECLDDSDGIVEYAHGDYFGEILRAFLAAGGAARGRVGGAPSELFDARAMVDFAVAWMGHHLAGPHL